MDACYYKPPYHILLSHIWQPLPPSIYRHCQINAWLRHSYCCQRIKVNIVHVHTAKRRDAKPNKSQIEAVCLIIFLWSAKGITIWECDCMLLQNNCCAFCCEWKWLYPDQRYSDLSEFIFFRACSSDEWDSRAHKPPVSPARRCNPSLYQVILASHQCQLVTTHLINGQLVITHLI